MIKSTKKTIKRVDDRTGSMTGAPSPKERAMMDKKAMPKTMPKIKLMPMNTKVVNSTPMMKKKKK